MHSLRSRLILSHILPFLVLLPLVGVALTVILETQVLIRDLSQDISERAALVAAAVSTDPAVWQDAQQAQAFVARMGALVDGATLLYGPDGALVAASRAGEGMTELGDDVDRLLATGEPYIVVSYGVFRQEARAVVPVVDAQEKLLGIVAITETLEGLSTRFGRVRQWILVTVLVTMVLGGLVGYWLAVRLAGPITESTRAVATLAAGQPVDPLPEHGPDELRGLARGVNVLSERLRQLEEIRRRSLANIVHELGRPLGAMRSAVHVLRTGAGDDPQIRQELLTGVEGQIERMQPLLDDLAQLHGQFQGSVALSPRPVALSEWLPPVLLPWRAAALEKGLAWQVDLPAGLPTVQADPDRLAQAVGNLLSNAIKYTPVGGTVSVSAGSEGEIAWISVADTGPGIAPAEQAWVFEPFYRSERERRFPQGLGLGLTIARDLVEAHGGRLELETESGLGSRFTIRLPA